MSYDPNFINGHAVALPGLSATLQAKAHNNGEVIDHTRFSLTFHRERGFAFYTAHNIDGESVIAKGEIPRRDQFRFDPDLPNSIQVDNKQGYRNNPWDRGHLVRRRSLHWGSRSEAEEADSKSFFWSNIAPQHENLHDGPWGNIEDWMFEVADTQDRKACVFTGPVLRDDDPEHTNAPGESPIRIPAGFWKIITVEHSGKLLTASFLVWQRDFDRAEPLEFDPVLEQVRLTTIEFLTGLAFSPLRDADPLKFGAKLDASVSPRVRSASAQKRSAVITCAEDIFL